MTNLTHLDQNGQATMVDVAMKPVTSRQASASATVILAAETFQRVTAGETTKGNIFAVARIAGIMAAKRASELIPLCHSLPLSHVGIEFEPDSVRNCIRIHASVRVSAQTGVEMEALTAATIAALTIYDMCKSMDRSIRIDEVRLTEKSGGRSGTYVAD